MTISATAFMLLHMDVACGRAAASRFPAILLRKIHRNKCMGNTERTEPPGTVKALSQERPPTKEDSVSFFSVLTRYMETDSLQYWTDKAGADKKTVFLFACLEAANAAD